MGNARRTAFALLVAGLLAAAALIGTTTSPASAAGTKSGPCIGYRWAGHDLQGAIALHREVPDRVERLIRCAVARWPVPGGAAAAIDTARDESGLWPWAYNPGGYAGVFQQSTRYWPDRARRYLRPRWFGGRTPGPLNGRANVLVSVRMAHAAGWCHDWPHTAPGC